MRDLRCQKKSENMLEKSLGTLDFSGNVPQGIHDLGWNVPEKVWTLIKFPGNMPENHGMPEKSKICQKSLGCAKEVPDMPE